VPENYATSDVFEQILLRYERNKFASNELCLGVSQGSPWQPKAIAINGILGVATSSAAAIVPGVAIEIAISIAPDVAIEIATLKAPELARKVLWPRTIMSLEWYG
jgi:hypothetical protein